MVNTELFVAGSWLATEGEALMPTIPTAMATPPSKGTIVVRILLLFSFLVIIYRNSILFVWIVTALLAGVSTKFRQHLPGAVFCISVSVGRLISLRPDTESGDAPCGHNVSSTSR